MTPFATPRRLAVSITEVLAVAPDTAVEQKLMPAEVAFGPDGEPTEALRKKLTALGRGNLATRAPEATDGADRRYTASDGKADYVFLSSVAKGLPLERGLQEALDEALAKLPIPKVMSYAAPGHYYNNEKFVRPAHKLLALHGARIVPVARLALDCRSHRRTAIASCRAATSRSPMRDAYAPTLEAEGKVIPSFAARRAQIVVALEGAAGDATPIMPDALLDEVTALVEWPVVYAGTFDAAFLAVPQECLILTMQLNQRYFALADDAGKLVNRFLVVSNLETPDPSAIVAGNERVLRARLADAKFFFDQDRRQRLDARVERLRRHRLSQQARHAGAARRAPARARAAHRAAGRRGRRAGRPRGAARQGRSRHRHGRRISRAAGPHGPLLRRARRRGAGRRRRDRAALLAEGRGRRAAADGRSRKRSRSPTSSKRSRDCSASARCRPATRTRSGCAARRSASCAS